MNLEVNFTSPSEPASPFLRTDRPSQFAYSFLSVLNYNTHPFPAGFSKEQNVQN